MYCKPDQLTAFECQVDKSEFGDYSAICPVATIFESVVEKVRIIRVVMRNERTKEGKNNE